MNGSSTTPRSFSAGQLHSALGDVGGPARPDYLPDIVAQAGSVRQRPAWTFLHRWLPSDIAVRRQGVPRAAVVFASAFLLVALLAAGAVYVGSHWTQPERRPGLPTTPGDWQRVRLEAPSGTGRVASLAVSPRGLLAAVGGDEPTHLEVSTDGRHWTLVPDGQLPGLSDDRSFGMPTLVGTDRGFLMLQLNEIWISENGYDWRRLAGETTDPDLSMGGPYAATEGGPGLVGVGGDRAWYSVDGSDWSLAAVPALPEPILARPDSDRYVAMYGVTAAGNDLVAWGLAEVPLEDNGDEHLVMPLLWTSHDGVTWASVVEPDMERVTAVTGGPHGFVATGQAGAEAAVWFSDDGESWERVGDAAFSGHELNAAAATSAGYVVVGSDGPCRDASCPDLDIVMWTSADGRSWSRVPRADLFTGAKAYTAIAWGSSFVVGGAYERTPAIWITGSELSGTGANVGSGRSPGTPTRPPGQQVTFAGTWETTDPPPDRSHLTMELASVPNGSYELTVRDDYASVCDGASSTMTGVAEPVDLDTIVIAQPDYTCDDGSDPHALSGPPLDEQLGNLSFTYDSLRDALFDSAGLEWVRRDVAP